MRRLRQLRWVQDDGPFEVGDLAELSPGKWARVLSIDRFKAGSIDEAWATVQPCNRRGPGGGSSRPRSVLLEKDGKNVLPRWTRQREE